MMMIMMMMKSLANSEILFIRHRAKEILHILCILIKKKKKTLPEISILQLRNLNLRVDTQG